MKKNSDLGSVDPSQNDMSGKAGNIRYLTNIQTVGTGLVAVARLIRDTVIICVLVHASINPAGAVPCVPAVDHVLDR